MPGTAMCRAFLFIDFFPFFQPNTPGSVKSMNTLSWTCAVYDWVAIIHPFKNAAIHIGNILIAGFNQFLGYFFAAVTHGAIHDNGFGFILRQ